MRKFGVTIEWYYHGPKKEHYVDCTIYPVDEEFIAEYNGYIVVGDRDGIEIHTFDNLEKAIKECGFKPKYIQFKGLTSKEKLWKKEIIKEIKK